MREEKKQKRISYLDHSNANRVEHQLWLKPNLDSFSSKQLLVSFQEKAA